MGNRLTNDPSTLEWRRQVFERYVLARRAARIPGYRLEVRDDITRHLPVGGEDEALLAFARFTPENAAQRIRAELGDLRGHGWEAEWKVHDFDEPADLMSRLEAQGLRCHHAEALMVLEVGDQPAVASTPGDAIVEAASGPAIDEIAALQEEVWQCRLPWMAGVLRETIDPVHGSGEIFCVRAGGRVVGSGWIDFHGGSPFAQLCGAAVLPEWRGRGIYSLLFDRRIEAAKARRTPFIAVDAAPMSRPILEGKGFRYVCGTYPMRTRPHDTGAVTRS